MGKPLSEMTLEELWELFPIILEEHNERWKDLYNEEESRLLTFLPEADSLRIHHIGSTAVESIWAKPIVDILVEAPEGSMEHIKESLIKCGYICMSDSINRKSFNLGYTSEGFAEKVFHLHLRRYGDNDELYFRDYMNDHPDLAKQYELLKLSLWKQFEHDRDGYTAVVLKLLPK